jgi:small subunit ribosomal protein S14
MAKKGLIQSNLLKQKKVMQFSSKRLTLKMIANNRLLSVLDRFNASVELAKLPRNSSKTRVRNRCFFSGRSRAVYNKLGLSRIALREFSSAGLIPGFVKSSW